MVEVNHFEIFWVVLVNSTNSFNQLWVHNIHELIWPIFINQLVNNRIWKWSDWLKYEWLNDFFENGVIQSMEWPVCRLIKPGYQLNSLVALEDASEPPIDTTRLHEVPERGWWGPAMVLPGFHASTLNIVGMSTWKPQEIPEMIIVHRKNQQDIWVHGLWKHPRKRFLLMGTIENVSPNGLHIPVDWTENGTVTHHILSVQFPGGRIIQFWRSERRREHWVWS